MVKSREQHFRLGPTLSFLAFLSYYPTLHLIRVWLITGLSCIFSYLTNMKTFIPPLVKCHICWHLLWFWVLFSFQLLFILAWLSTAWYEQCLEYDNSQFCQPKILGSLITLHFCIISIHNCFVKRTWSWISCCEYQFQWNFKSKIVFF